MLSKTNSSTTMNHDHNIPPIELARELLSYIPKRPNYDLWIRIIAAIGNTYDEETALNLLLWRFDDEKPNEHAVKLKERLKEVNFGTLVYYAHEYGFDWNKSKYKDLPIEFKPIKKRPSKFKIKKSYYNDNILYSYNENSEPIRVYRVAVNDKVIDKNLNPATLKPRSEFTTLNEGFTNKLLSINEIIETISKGHALIFAHLKEDDDGKIHRSKQNFVAADLFALDFDGGTTINEVLNHKLTNYGGLLLYTTASHTEKKHRFRLIYQLDFVVVNVDFYEYIIKKYMQIYNEKNKVVDTACKDAARIFYGNRNSIIINLKTGEVIK